MNNVTNGNHCIEKNLKLKSKIKDKYTLKTLNTTQEYIQTKRIETTVYRLHCMAVCSHCSVQSAIFSALKYISSENHMFHHLLGLGSWI